MVAGPCLLKGVVEVYQARLVITQVMDLWHISGAILTDEPDGDWKPVASFSDDVPLAQDLEQVDEVTSMLRAIRLWSEMTISR